MAYLPAEVARQGFKEWAGIAQSKQARRKECIQGQPPTPCVEMMVPIAHLLFGIRQLKKLPQIFPLPPEQPCDGTAAHHQTLRSAHLRRAPGDSRFCIGNLPRIDVYCCHRMSRGGKSACRTSRAGDAEDTAARFECAQFDSGVFIHHAEDQFVVILTEGAAPPWGFLGFTPAHDEERPLPPPRSGSGKRGFAGSSREDQESDATPR